jgi:hypothetical protein
MASPVPKNDGYYHERVTPSSNPKNIFPEMDELLQQPALSVGADYLLGGL